MKKFFKILFYTLGVIILVAAISIGLLVTFVSPNKFKPIISAQVLKYTGRTLTIDGNLSWSFFPYLSLTAGHMVLENPTGFTNKKFAEIDNAKIGVKLMPLLHGKVETNGISITGLKVNLIKSETGVNNWVFAPVAPIAAAAQLQNQTHDKYMLATSTKNMLVDIVIPSIDIDKASFTWTDLQSKQSAKIDHFEFHAKNLNLNTPFNVKSSFDVDAAGNKFDVQLSCGIATNITKHIIKITDFKTTINHLKQIKGNINLRLNAVANLANDTLNVANFTVRAANLNLSGKANVSNLTGNPQVIGHLKAEPFDLKSLLQSLGQDNANLQTAKMLSANVDFSDDVNSNLQGISLQSKIKLDELQAANIKATDLNIDANMQNGVLNFTAINASIYQGFLKSQAKVVLTTAQPQIIFSGKLGDIQIGPLLQDAEKKDSKFKVKGTGNVDLQITTVGFDKNSLIHNLNGTSHFSIVNGQLEGVNIGNMIDKAYATIKGQPAPADGENVTNFGVLTGSATISNGVISNNDLYIDSPRFDTKGKGVIDLVNQHIDYVLETNMKNVAANHDDSNALNLYNIAIPIRISGNLTSPTARLDLGSLAQSIAKLQMQNAVKDKIKNVVGDKIQLKGNLGDKANKLINNFLGN